MGLKTIGPDAFSCCTSLSSIDIPNSVEMIDLNAFYNCISLVCIRIPNSVTNLENAVFDGCDRLEQIKLPSSLVKLSNLGVNLHSLKTVVLPSSLEEIDYGAFLGTDSLKTMICYSSIIPHLYEFDYYRMFTPSISNGTLYVPAGLVSAYQSTESWKDWGTILPIVPIESIQLTNVTLEQSSQKAIAIHTLPANATEGQIFYSSSNPKVATISPEGVITAVGMGTASITAETLDGQSATCTVTVLPKFYKITYVIDEKTYQTDSITAGDAIVLPKDPTKTGYIFSGWEDLPTDSIMPDQDLELTAVFKKLGDADDDGVVDGADLVAIVNYIMGMPAVGFIKATGDYNCDGEIDGRDYVCVVNDILGADYPSRVRAMTGTPCADNLSVLPFTMKRGEEQTVGIRLHNETNSYTLVQFDLDLPDGVSMVEDSWAMSDAIRKHSLNVCRQEDGSYRFLMASSSNKTIGVKNDDIIYVTLKADENATEGEHSLTLFNQLLVKTDGSGVEADATSARVNIEGATKISVWKEEDLVDVYNTIGQIVKHSVPESTVKDGLQHGLYIINGKKIIIK